MIFGPVVRIELNAVSYLAFRWHYGTHNHTYTTHRVTSMWTYRYHLLCYCLYMYFWWLLYSF